MEVDASELQSVGSQVPQVADGGTVGPQRTRSLRGQLGGAARSAQVLGLWRDPTATASPKHPSLPNTLWRPLQDPLSTTTRRPLAFSPVTEEMTTGAAHHKDGLEVEASHQTRPDVLT
jgi:hypothetical protein